MKKKLLKCLVVDWLPTIFVLSNTNKTGGNLNSAQSKCYLKNICNLPLERTTEHLLFQKHEDNNTSKTFPKNCKATLLN